jgi:hypothetical protein
MSTETYPAPAPAVALPAPVSERTRAGLGVAAGALALGIAGDALLRPLPWGLNAALWCAALAIAATGLQRWAGTQGAVTGWIPVALPVSTLLAWRDSPTLKGLDLAVLAIVVGLAVWRSCGGSVWAAGLARYCVGLFEALGHAAFGAGPLLASDIRWSELRRDGWTRHALAAARGAIIALPLLFLFGSLLMSADAAFDRLITQTFHIDLPLAVSHTLLAASIGWLSAGVLRALVTQQPLGALPALPAATTPAAGPRLGIVETAMVLGLLDVLFLTFVIVQLPHFFGSYRFLLAPGTTTFADYARRGFFELCAVSGLVLPLLMGTHWLLRKDDPRHETAFRAVAGAMVALVFVIIASALHRMRLYTSAYGLTQLRLYTVAFMVWLTAVFGWFCWTVLRGRRDRFVFGALSAGVGTVVMLHAVNPDALIVRVNASRRDAPVQFDAVYAAGLSGDAVPVLLGRLGAVPAASRCDVVRLLLAEWSGAGEDWRAWSLGRSRAVAAVRARSAGLRRACPPLPAPRTVPDVVSADVTTDVTTIPPVVPAPAPTVPASAAATTPPPGAPPAGNARPSPSAEKPASAANAGSAAPSTAPASRP